MGPDQRILDVVVDHRSTGLDTAMRVVTEFGSFWVLWLIGIAVTIVWWRRFGDAVEAAGARVPFKWVKLIGDTLKAFALPYQIRTLDGKQPATLMRKGGRPVELPKILPE